VELQNFIPQVFSYDTMDVYSIHLSTNENNHPILAFWATAAACTQLPT